MDKKIAAGLAILLLGVVSLRVQASNDMERQLLQRISTSQSELQKVQSLIAKESQSVARRLNASQDELVKLREQAAAVQRLAEEKTLSLETLQNRIEQWQAQSQYQKHLITAYVEKNNLNTEAFEQLDGAPQLDVSAVALALDRVDSLLRPKWEPVEIVDLHGQIQPHTALSIGPVKVALDMSGRHAGLVVTGMNSNTPEMQTEFYGDQAEELFAIKKTGKGFLAFDPTLGNAYQLNTREGSLVSHIRQGGIWAMPILFFGLLSFVIALVKGVQLVRLPKVESARVFRSISNLDRDASTASKALAHLLKLKESLAGAQKELLGIVTSSPVSAQRDDLMVACLREHKHSIERYMGVVATSAAIAPLLGLLGTVSGMINTFKMMTIFGAGDAATVSGGISEALVTTELGLIVAIPSLIVSALLTRKTKSYNHRLETMAIKLSKVAV